jgi:formylglycine-generating enzyme required for sulfatase activity
MDKKITPLQQLNSLQALKFPKFTIKSTTIPVLKMFQFDVAMVKIRPKLFGNGSAVKINHRRSQAQYFSEDLGKGIVLEMVYIPGGTFMMGSPEGEGCQEEKPQHEVSVSSFFMGKYPITQAQWRAIAKDASAASGAIVGVARDLDPEPSRFKPTFSSPIDEVQKKHGIRIGSIAQK